MELKTHTILFLVGPSHSGKSYFVREVLIPKLRDNYGQFIKIINVRSDAIRAELLGYDPNDNGVVEFLKHDQEMMQVSAQAFKMFYEKITLASSYPVNAEFIIADATGLSPKSQNDVIKIAKQNHYNVDAIVFDYSNVEDYYKYANQDHVDRSVIDKHVKTFKENTLEYIKSKTPAGKSDSTYRFDQIHYVKSIDFSEVNVFVNDAKEYESHYLDNHGEYVIIGDIHGCLDEFICLLTDGHGFTIEDGIIQEDERRIILVGDYIDKGPQIRETLKFIYDNKKMFHIVSANHENFVVKFLNGEVRRLDDSIMSWFNSVDILNLDDKKMLEELWADSRHFFKNDKFIVTHAPCMEKYLGKIDNISKKKQRNWVQPRRDKDAESFKEYSDKLKIELSFIEEQSNKVKPYHFFGHIMWSKALKVNNSFGIDTGCVAGNKLISAMISEMGVILTEVNSLYEDAKEELPIYGDIS